MRIVCLPIDSRPCNTQFVKSVTEWGGGTCILPQGAEMDNFRQPAPFDKTQAFLLRELPKSDAAVISLDHWCYGSLLASREAFIDELEAVHRVDVLRSILASYKKPVYLSSVILRSSLSTLCSGDLAAYHAMTEYSIHAFRFFQSGDLEEKKAAQKAASRIPAGLLQRALAVRSRNLEVNLAAVELAASGLCTTLSILQEDTQVDGLPRIDQKEIIRRIEQVQAKNIYLRNGTDEAGTLSAARALGEHKPPVHAQIAWLGCEGFTAPYEDRPFSQNLESACAEIGIVQDTCSDTVIAVCCPESEDVIKEHESVPDDHLKSIAEAVNHLLNSGKRVYLLDVIRPNGGIFPLMGMLTHPEKLWGYSAWNTASNSMGTLLAQVVTDHLHGAPNRSFLAERLLDDWLYQAKLRKKIDMVLREHGEDVYALDDKAAAEEQLRNLYAEVLPECWPLGPVPEYRISLPWPRTFEVHAEVF